MSDYMPKCANCEHFESCIIQKHITEMALILWNISREKEKETTDNFSTATDIVKAIKEAEYRGYMKAVADRPQGKWILSDLQSQADNDKGNYSYVCTNCNHTDIHAKTQKVPYCWWCGARMKGADDEENV